MHRDSGHIASSHLYFFIFKYQQDGWTLSKSDFNGTVQCMHLVILIYSHHHD